MLAFFTKMDREPTFDQQFDEYREQLHAELRRLVSYARVYRRLHDRKADRLREMNIAPAFFGITMDALYGGIIIWTHKLFDPRGERGLWNFLSMVENNRSEFSVAALRVRRGYDDGHWMLNRQDLTYNEIEEFRQEIRSNDALRSVKLRRDKYYAHFDKAYFLSKAQFAEDAPLNWAELDGLLVLGRRIVNECSVAFDGKSYAADPLNIHDIDRLLQKLHGTYKES